MDQLRKLCESGGAEVYNDMNKIYKNSWKGTGYAVKNTCEVKKLKGEEDCMVECRERRNKKKSTKKKMCFRKKESGSVRKLRIMLDYN